METTIRNVAQLKQLIKDLPDDMPIVVANQKNGLSFKYGIMTDANCSFDLNQVKGIPPKMNTAEGLTPALYFSGPA